MRYGSLTPDKAFDALLKREPGLEEVIAVPLYPHYAMSSYETAVEHAKAVHTGTKNIPFKLSFIKPFFDNPSYLNALAENIKPYLAENYDHILFSYHGIPARHIHRDDPAVTKRLSCIGRNRMCSGSAGTYKLLPETGDHYHENGHAAIKHTNGINTVCLFSPV